MPNVTFYGEASKSSSGKKRRTHLWSTALATLHSAVGKSMADVDDTPQSAAARSMLALSFDRWGCMNGNPLEWEYGYLAEHLENYLRAARCKYLGDAY